METFSILMDTITGKYFWYDVANKKFSKAYATQADAEQAARNAGKEIQVAFD